MHGQVSGYIRSHVWVVVACFIVLMGAAVAASASDSGPGASSSAAGPAKQVKKLKGRVAGLSSQLTKLTGELGTLQARLAALEGKPAPVIPAIPTTLPPSGPAGGELAGSYPNPAIGTVSGLDLAESESPTGGINFGSDVTLYRPDPLVFGEALRTDDPFFAPDLRAEGFFASSGDSQLGDSATDQAQVVGWLKIRAQDALPPANECDSSGEEGRLVYRRNFNELWVCDDSGWLQEIFD